MKRLISLFTILLLFTSGTAVAAKDITVSDPFPEGSVLNPATHEDTIVFGDLNASIVAYETDEDGDHSIQLQVENNSRATLWIEPSHFSSFKQGLFNNDGKHDGGHDSFFVESMETETGIANIAYEWFMVLPGGTSGILNIHANADVEVMCFQPYHHEYNLLMDASVEKIHGCWSLGD